MDASLFHATSMTRRYLLLAIGVALAGCAALDPNRMLSRGGHTPSAEFPAPALPANWREQAFDFVWNTINERYYAAKLNGVDWRAVGDRYRPLALGAKNDDAFWEQLDNMTGELKDAHTRVESPKQVDMRRRNETLGFGLNLTLLDDKLVVTQVHGDSDAWWVGVRPGMRLVSMDGEEALARFARASGATRHSSTERARESRILRKMFEGEQGATATLRFARADGSEFEASLSRRLFNTRPIVTTRKLPSGVGYVRFTGFSALLQSQVLDAVRGFRDARGLIVDVRGNGGGSLLFSQALIRAVLREPIEKNQRLTRDGKPVTLLFGLVDAIKVDERFEPSEDAFKGPLAILVDARSASASEVLAATLQDVGRAIIVGQPTCGCLLGYLGYAAIPGGGELAYSEIGFVTPKGKRVEGEGVVPDIVVPIDARDLQVSRDRALEEAQRLVLEQASSATTQAQAR